MVPYKNAWKMIYIFEFISYLQPYKAHSTLHSQSFITGDEHYRFTQIITSQKTVESPKNESLLKRQSCVTCRGQVPKGSAA
jgi:hypothetical protein